MQHMFKMCYDEYGEKKIKSLLCITISLYVVCACVQEASDQSGEGQVKVILDYLLTLNIKHTISPQGMKDPGGTYSTLTVKLLINKIC